MKVSDVMSTDVMSVPSSASLMVVFEIIFQKKINAVPVVDSEKKLVGILTKDDLLQLLYPNMIDFVSQFSDSTDYEAMEKKIPDLKNRKAKDVMSTRVVFTRKETPAMRALSRMIAQRVNQLPVVDENGKIVGLLTKGDIFYTLFRRSRLPRQGFRIAR